MEVFVIERAVTQLESNYQWRATNRSQEQAARWYNGFVDAIVQLEENPKRWSLAEENGEFPFEVRELHFGIGAKPSHRALFTIRPDCVVVFSIRHVAQQRATLDDY